MKRRRVRRNTNSSFSTKAFTKRKPPSTGRDKKTGKPLWVSGLKFIPYVLLFGIILYVLVFSDFFHIKQIDVTGPSSTLVDELQTSARSNIQGNLLAQSWWFLDTNWLAGQLKKQFSQQEKIVVTKQFPNRITIQTDEQTPAMVWQSGGKLFLVSVSGRVIAEQGTNENKNLVRITDSSNLPVNPGSHIVSKELIIFMQKVKLYFEQHSLGEPGFTVAETTSELMVKTKDGYTIKFDTTQDSLGQLQSLTAVLDQLQAQKKKPSEYIDLRVPGKVFYK